MVETFIALSQAGFPNLSAGGIWCRLATDRRCWFFTLSKNEPAPKTVNSFTFTTQSGRGKFNDIPFGQIVATFIPCGGLPNLPLAVYTTRNKI